MCTICACFSPLAFFEDYIKMWYIGSNCSNCKFNTQNIPERKKKKKTYQARNPLVSSLCRAELICHIFT